MKGDDYSWTSGKKTSRSLSNPWRTHSQSLRQLRQSAAQRQQNQLAYQQKRNQSLSGRADWQAYAQTTWWGQVQPPNVGYTSGTGTNDMTKLVIGWSPKILDPAAVLMEFLMADLCERFTRALVGWAVRDFGGLEEELHVPANALLSLAELMQFELVGFAVRLPKEHPLWQS